MSALLHLVQIVRACRHRLGEDLHSGTTAMADLKRRIIRDCLFGVDIEPEAVELAALRLWLSLVLDLDPKEDPDPLPNLDFNLMVGNSLIDSIEGVPLAPEHRRTDAPLRMALDESDVRLKRIADLKRQFYATSDLPADVREQRRQEIKAEEMATLRAYWEQRADECFQQADALGKALSQGRGLNNQQQAELARQTARGIVYRKAAEAVFAGDQTTRPFVYELEFADIFADRGGFDIVIANPPYVSVQGSSGLPYRPELEKRYTERSNGKEKGWVDDLYVHFVFRAFELARQSGVVCYITSDTYFTIQSKRRMRELLHGKDLRVVAPCDPFRATVDAAVFLGFNRPRLAHPECEFDQMRYVADEAFDRLAEEPDWRDDATLTVDSAEHHVREWTDNNLRRYRFDPRLWLGTQRMAVWEPSVRNCALYERLILPAEPLIRKWWDKISTSEKYRQNRNEIEAYLKTLKPGDITLLGLIADGGQGLATANNGRFLAYGDSSPQGQEILKRRKGHVQRWNSDAAIGPIWRDCLAKTHGDEGTAIDLLRQRTGEDRRLGLGKGELYKTVRPEQCIESEDIERLTDAERDYLRYHGVAGTVRRWAPFRKGDREGRRWWADDPLYIDWSEESVRWLFANSGKKAPNMPVIRNAHLYFRPGVTWSRTGNHTMIKARLQPAVVFDADSPTFESLLNGLSAESLVAYVNAPVTSYIWKHFLNNTNKYEIGDFKEVVMEVTGDDTAVRLVEVTRDAKRGKTEAGDQIDAILGLAKYGPFDEF